MPLSTLSPTSSKLSRGAVEDSILGLKTSAAFLSSLGTNLRLNSSSPVPSPALSPHTFGRAAPIAPPPTSPSLSGTATQLRFLSKDLPNLSPLSHIVGPPSLNPSSKPIPPKDIATKGGHVPSTTPPSNHGDGNHTIEDLYTAYTSTSSSSKQAALNLIASTVLAQRHTSVRALCTHPLSVFLFAFSLFLLERIVRSFDSTPRAAPLPKPSPLPIPVVPARGASPLKPPVLPRTPRPTADPASGPPFPWAILCLAWTIFALLTYLTTTLALRHPYTRLARTINADWLGNDEIVIVRAPRSPAPPNDDAANEDEAAPIIGALVLSYRTRDSGCTGKASRRRRSLGRGFVRAWAVAPASRGTGAGAALLAEAARIAASRGGEGVWFARDHAHSERVLPDFFNGVFDRRDRRAQAALAAAVDAQWAIPRRRWH